METLLNTLMEGELFSGFPEELILSSVLPHRQIQEYRKGVFPIVPQQRVAPSCPPTSILDSSVMNSPVSGCESSNRFAHSI